MAGTSYSVRDGTAWVRLERPEVRNAIDVATLGALGRAARQAEADVAVRRVVLAGQGPAFCAGGDIREMSGRRGQSAATFERHMEGLADLVGRVAASEKVWIARVQGDAVGAGLGLVLMCDLAVAAQTARFSAAFGRVGLVADTGVSALLARAVGLPRAKSMLLTGRALDAEEAVDWGILDRSVPAEALDAAVDEILRALDTVPPATLGRLKRQIHRNARVPLEDALVFEALSQGVSFATPEHAERAEAFLARRRREA